MTKRYNKVLIIGDVHARYEPFAAAVEYGRSNDMFLLSLGDLCDENQDGPQVFKMMVDLIYAGAGLSLMGNHEWKILRWMNGNSVKLSSGNQVTVDQLLDSSEFTNHFEIVTRYAKFAGTTRANQIISLPDTPAHNIGWTPNSGRKRLLAFAHAGVRARSWSKNQIERADRQTVLFGETSGEFYEHNGRSLPVRTYGWVDHVPASVNLFVGHDTRAFLPLPKDGEAMARHSVPLQKTNAQGGRVWFMDTGCGKGGTLSGAVYNLAEAEVEEILDFGA